MIYADDPAISWAYGQCAKITALCRQRGFTNLALLETFFEARHSLDDARRLLDAMQRQADTPHTGVALPRVAGVARLDPDEPVIPDDPPLRMPGQPKPRHQL
jgi:hypothetical protein